MGVRKIIRGKSDRFFDVLDRTGKLINRFDGFVGKSRLISAYQRADNLIECSYIGWGGPLRVIGITRRGPLFFLHLVCINFQATPSTFGHIRLAITIVFVKNKRRGALHLILLKKHNDVFSI
jgi:hypothetical protein